MKIVLIQFKEKTIVKFGFINTLTQWTKFMVRNCNMFLYSYRYVFKAWPAGTHWYHSHVSTQRDEGLYGVLIVKYDDEDHPNIIDKPEKNVIAIREHEIEQKEGSTKSLCEPDNSGIHLSDATIKSIRINEQKLDSNLDETKTQFKPVFYLPLNERYRFRVIGVMYVLSFRLSIDGHKLKILAADGYLTKEKIVDYLIIHIGERYDIEVISNNGMTPKHGDVYPIRIESIAIDCGTKAYLSGFAYLQYKNDLIEECTSTLLKQTSRCKEENCTALNCPFEYYPLIESQNIICEPLTNLQLLHSTLEKEMPKKERSLIEEYFFNFHFGDGSYALVNGVQFAFPTLSFTNPNLIKPPGECKYHDIDDSKYNTSTEVCDTCPHAVYIHRLAACKEPRTIRFIFSAIEIGNEYNPKHFTRYHTHPIHLHGHSFFVSKIGYPEYYKNDTIKAPNGDVTVEKCGHGHWTTKRPGIL